MAGKIVGGWYASGVQFQAQEGANPTRTITIPDGWYYPLGDGSADDLLDTINDELASAGGGELGDCVFEMSSTGVARIDDNGTPVTITWTSDGEGLRDLLRFSGATQVTTGTPVSAERVHLGGYYPVRCAVEDIEETTVLASQSEADDGSLENITYATRSGHRLVMQANEASPYALAYNEYHALRSFVLDWAGQGRRFRWYRNASETAEYSAVSNPDGWQTFKAVLSSVRAWSPIPEQDGYYTRWIQSLDLRSV